MRMTVAVVWVVLGLMTAAVAGPSSPPGDGPERREHDGQRGWRRGKGLSPAEVQEAIAVLRRVDPESADAVEAMAKEKPTEVAAELRRRFPRIDGFLALKRMDPQMFDLRVEDLRLAHETRRVARAYRQAAAAEDPARDPDDLKREMERLLEEHFDVRQRIRERELAMLEARIETLREQLEERADEKDDLIEARLEELTKGETDAEW